MTKKEAIRQTEQENTLMALGFTRDEAEALRRISMTLHRWHERECGDDNGCIERDEASGKTFWLNSYTMRRTPIADRETGARKRLEVIIKARNERSVRQTACRHCGLDIEGAYPFTEWRDRGNNPYHGDHFHAPAFDDREHEPLSAYIQTDPRGAALYILRPGDVPDGGNVESYYNRGIVVY